jgi:hypothetical protein
MSEHTPGYEMRSFTPGPWEWEVRKNCYRRLTGSHYASVIELDQSEYPGPDATMDVTDADARLIAAAPELLEALSLLVSILPDDSYLDSEEKKIARIARTALQEAGDD